MKTAYFDCLSGISGDMTLGALVDAGVPLEDLNVAIESLGLPGCHLAAAEVKKNGFRALQVTVLYQEEHAHRHLSHILKMIEGSALNDRQKDMAARVFRRLAEAEAKVHGTTIEKVHFHEVGAADSIADIVGAAVGLDLLGVERIAASPVPTGCGTVRIAHGLCSVPAPATAELLAGIPLAECSIPKEMTTPTGAAILATLADRFGPLPAMRIEKIGYGAGQRELEQQPNILRLLIGETELREASPAIWILEVNLDDMPGEQIAYCTERLWDAGVLDVYTTAIQMKKNRPAVKLTVLCSADRIEDAEKTLLRETTTLGIRRWQAQRTVLDRTAHTVETPLGSVAGKVGRLPDGSLRFAPEYEACRQVAQRENVPLREVFEMVQRAFNPSLVEWSEAD
ncbi:MAG: nickel pincer cofactor biosynthesis protein LarC [Planctomycetaceae bacterium]|nr:nickel pincer cofactor biosynthesis protein LarC [Planctomycetaceae bacterium]